jgi:hypothetical protein
MMPVAFRNKNKKEGGEIENRIKKTCKGIKILFAIS